MKDQRCKEKKEKMNNSNNLTFHKTSLTRRDRETLKKSKSACLWFTGLSGSGKSTIANALEVKLNEIGVHTYLLDGDSKSFFSLQKLCFLSLFVF